MLWKALAGLIYNIHSLHCTAGLSVSHGPSLPPSPPPLLTLDALSGGDGTEAGSDSFWRELSSCPD